MKMNGILPGIVIIAMILFHQRTVFGQNATKPVDTTEVKIGNQVWMARNLDVYTFRNGDSIPHAKTKSEWTSANAQQKPAWCYYNNDPANGEIYGKLYNWWAVNDPRGLAPEGWRVPASGEWLAMADYLGGKYGFVGIKLKSKSWWNKERNGLNTTGFDARPAGVRDTGAMIDGNQGFGGLGVYGCWWSASGPARRGDDLFTFVLNGRKDYTIHWCDEGEGHSVRCVKDAE